MFAYPLGGGAELRPLEPWQAAEFAEHVARSRAHLAPWLPWATTVTDEESARQFLRRYAEAQANDAGRIYGIWLDEVLVGGTLFRVFDVGAGSCEVGVWLAPEAEGRGLITRAVRHMIDWAVGVRGMARVEWRTLPHNHRSIAGATRQGMTHEGVLRLAFPIRGIRQDVEVWSLLAGEWHSRR